MKTGKSKKDKVIGKMRKTKRYEKREGITRQEEK